MAPCTFLEELNLHGCARTPELASYVFHLKDTECFSGNLGLLRRIFINKLTELSGVSKFIARRCLCICSSLKGVVLAAVKF